MPRLIVLGYTLSLAPCVFRWLLASLAVMVCNLLAHAQLIDSTYILAVDRRVQEIGAVQEQGLSTNAHRAFPFYPFCEIPCCR